MKEVVLTVCIIAISLSNAHFHKKPNIDVFEISENQLTKKLQVQPVKLQYDLESEEEKRETESQASILGKLLLSFKKKKIMDASKEILKKIQKELAVKKQQEPVMLIVSPEYLDVLDPHYHSDQDGKMGSFLDKTRTKNLLRPGSEVVFNIVSPRAGKKALPPHQMEGILRDYGGEDRTEPPSPRHKGRPYV